MMPIDQSPELSPDSPMKRKFAREEFQARPTRWRRRDRHRIRWRDYIAHLAWECLEILQEELEGVVMERNIWARCIHDQDSDERWKMDGWKNQSYLDTNDTTTMLTP